MSVKTFLDDLLTQGKALAQKGENFAADKLGVGNDEGSRKTMRNTALAGGAIGLLLGSRSGRGLLRTGAVLGGLGWLGKVAYDAYRKTGGTAEQATEADRLDGEAAERRAIAITTAIIAAARSDGHIDDKEKLAIERGLSALPEDVAGLVSSQLTRPLDASAVAALADSEQAAREMYAASLLVTGGDDDAEKAYLADLARALNLSPDVIEEIEARIAP